MPQLTVTLTLMPELMITIARLTLKTRDATTDEYFDSDATTDDNYNHTLSVAVILVPPPSYVTLPSTSP